jgi:DNA-directed RNA polymerase specialized sigma subunit
MYKLNLIKTPHGKTLNGCIMDLYLNAPEEEAKDKIFRMTYYIAMGELQKYKHLIPVEEAVGELSVAFMKTFNNFDPTKEGASFLNYYKLTIRSEILIAKFGKYRNSEEGRELLMRMNESIDSLDEPEENKDGREVKTKGEVIPSGLNVEQAVLNKDLRNRVRAIGNAAFDSAKRRTEEYRPIFLKYLETATTDDPMDAKDLARYFDVPYYNIRRMLIKYVPIFMEMWKGEYGDENR